MTLDEGQHLARIPIGSFKTDLANEVHRNLMAQMDALMGIHWLNILLGKYPNPLPPGEGCAFGFTIGHDPAFQGVYGVTADNVQQKVANGLRWTTPMLITAVLSESEYLLSSLKEVRGGKLANENWYKAATRVLADPSYWSHPDLETHTLSFHAALAELSKLNKLRNAFIHRLTENGRKKEFTLSMNEIGLVWLYAIYITVVLDGLLVMRAVQQVDQSIEMEQ